MLHIRDKSKMAATECVDSAYNEVDCILTATFTTAVVSDGGWLLSQLTVQPRPRFSESDLYASRWPGRSAGPLRA